VSPTTVCKLARINSPPIATLRISARLQPASVKKRAVEEMTFPLDTARTTKASRISAQKATFVLTRKINVNLYSLLVALANSIATVRFHRILMFVNDSPSLKDQCEAPPNFSELADKLHRGLNFNGSVCLNNQCMYVERVMMFGKVSFLLGGPT
jgi:hypothetical protein